MAEVSPRRDWIALRATLATLALGVMASLSWGPSCSALNLEKRSASIETAAGKLALTTERPAEGLQDQTLLLAQETRGTAPGTKTSPQPRIADGGPDLSWRLRPHCARSHGEIRDDRGADGPRGREESPARRAEPEGTVPEGDHRRHRAQERVRRRSPQARLLPLHRRGRRPRPRLRGDRAQAPARGVGAGQPGRH